MDFLRKIMNFKTKGVNAEEIRFKLNPIKPSKETMEEKPLFQRQVKRSKDVDNEMMIVLTAKVESTLENPKIFDLFVSFVACYEVYDMTTQEDYESFVTQATRELYHYVRNAVITLTGSANVFTVILPVNPPYFPLN